MNGEMIYLWRAVDHEGEVLESYVTKKRDKSAALAFMKKALKRHGKAEAIVMDGLVSGGDGRNRAIIIQQKTNRPVQFEITTDVRSKLITWLERRGGSTSD